MGSGARRSRIDPRCQLCTHHDEGTDNTTPDKMKAVMEANKFVTWLQEQSEEESDEEHADE